MALFIDVEVDPAVAQRRRAGEEAGRGLPGQHLRARRPTALEIVEANLDECTLCELCLEAAPPGTVRVKKLYGSGEVLERSVDHWQCRAQGARDRRGQISDLAAAAGGMPCSHSFQPAGELASVAAAFGRPRPLPTARSRGRIDDGRHQASEPISIVWRELASKERKGASPDELVWHTPEGIDVKPLYTRADVEALDFARHHARRLPVPARPARHDVRRPAVDHPPVRRLLHRRGVQRVLPRATSPPGRWGCRSPSISPRTAATTATTRASSATSARPASRSIPSRT